MTPNAITITLDDVLGEEGLEGAYENMCRYLADKAAEEWRYRDGARSFHAACVKAIDEAIETRIKAEIGDRIKKPIQPTDSYGKPTGKATTFEEMIGQAVEDAFKVKVDAHGKPSNRAYDKTIVQSALESISAATVKQEVKKAVDSVKAETKEKMSSLVAEAIMRKLG